MAAQQDGGHRIVIPPQKIVGRITGVDQQNAVHPLADEKVKQRLDPVVSRAASGQHDLIALAAGIRLNIQRQSGIIGI